MSGVQEFENLEVWQRARELTAVVYELTSGPEWYRDRGLREQIRRAAVSAMSNIAEGFERRGDVEFARFLSIAKGSAGEVRSQFYVALDQGYTTKQSLARGFGLAKEVSRMIAGLARYLATPKQDTNADPGIST